MSRRIITSIGVSIAAILGNTAGAGDDAVFVPSVGHEEHCLAMFGQTSSQAYVRVPGTFCYRDGDQRELARQYWQYAVLSDAVYLDDSKTIREPPDIEASIAKCCPEAAIGWSKRWRRWTAFPNVDFVEFAARHGLYLEVWSNDSDRSVVVVMRGTEFTSLVDWLANFRWVRISRFFPGFNDQYSDISTKFAELFVDELANQYPDLDVKIYATGHSLGGGLAQHFAYSVAPLTSDGKPVPRVSQVFAFNPSPVTGWSSVRDTVIRDANAEKLHIHRIFEHGEILAYPRRLIGYVVTPKAEKPAIWEIRFNYLDSGDTVGSHSMQALSCSLINSAFAPDNDPK
ncbi:MAG: hypothetical protein IPJ12_07935 [Betaproteobacteria bacterium]|nr:hypothetical protein [Betaproteobacteria bacterium]